jgi:hypothetical protein
LQTAVHEPNEAAQMHSLRKTSHAATFFMDNRSEEKIGCIAFNEGIIIKI